MPLVQTEPKSIKLGTTDIKKVYLGSQLVRPALPYLCFTANTANTAFYIERNGSPISVSLEISYDGLTWTSYNISASITLSNVGDKVYFRNTSTTDTRFSTSTNNYYNFVVTSGTLSASGDITYLLNKNGTKTVSDYCFYMFFYGCQRLTSAPKLPATTLASYCYQNMFNSCTNLVTLPQLPAIALMPYCYQNMFRGCSKIKLSETQTGEYQTPYRIPTEGTGTPGTGSVDYMFYQTGGTYAPTFISMNTTYYTSNIVV